MTRPRTGAAPVPKREELARVSVLEQAGILIMDLAGEIDISNAPLLGAQLQELPNVAPGMVVDLSLLDFLDSGGIAFLHDLGQRLAERAQELVIVCPPTACAHRTLELTGISLRVPVVDSRQVALRHLRG